MALSLVVLGAMPALAAPVVKIVPWVPGTPGIPHDTYSGKTIYLKATTDGTATQFYWDYGDGSPVMAWTSVSSQYDIGTTHTYTGSVGQPFTATVYVKDAGGNTTTGKYFVTIRANNLQTKVNIAIDQALWRMHREMNRYGSGSTMYGYWNSGSYTSSGYYGNYAVNTTAFLVNGHQPDSNPANANPYAETAYRGINGTLYGLAATSVPASVTNARGTFSPDGNGNGSRIYVPQSDMYQGGMVMDMFVATNQPAAVAAVGGTGVIGLTYKDIVQDMMDYYTYCQGLSIGSHSGGWRYGCRYGDSDNSVCQWAAIGMLAAVDKFGLSYPPPIPGPGTSPVVLANSDWLNASFDSGSGGLVGGFGYQPGYWYPWSAWAVTPSGMVQMVMDGITRGTPGSPTKWDYTESMIRNNIGGPLGYYYGLFSFTKSMLLYPGGKLTQLCGRDGFPSNNLTNCVDWYAAEVSNGDPLDGIAKTLVNQQQSDGYWWCHEQNGTQCYFETAWATIILNKTVYASGLPVAVIDATPTLLANGGKVDFTGKNSFHQDTTKQIVNWEWDFGTGSFTATGVNQPGIVMSAPAPYPKTIVVRLRVTDDNVPPLTAISTVSITITSPPFPPSANAGGPYSICPQSAYLPFYLNGTGSSNPDNGQTDGTPGAVPDSIKEYAWDLLGTGSYSTYGPTQAQPRVDDFYTTKGLLGSGTTVLIGLRVTDNTHLAFPSAGLPDLQGFATAQVYLRNATDVYCTHCVSSAQAIPHGAVPGRAGYIQLVWLETGANHYNIYRGTANGGPYTKIASVANTVLNTGKSLGYSDNGPLTVGVTYYYRIAPATLADIETCQSNQANASGSLPRGR